MKFKEMKKLNLYNEKFIIKNNTHKKLIDLGFYRDADDTYIYNFIVLRHKKSIVLRGRIIAYTDSESIKFDVFDSNTGSIYPPFYNNNYGHYDILMKRINENILIEFKKLGIILKEEEKKNNE